MTPIFPGVPEAFFGVPSGSVPAAGDDEPPLATVVALPAPAATVVALAPFELPESSPQHTAQSPRLAATASPPTALKDFFNVIPPYLVLKLCMQVTCRI